MEKSSTKDFQITNDWIVESVVAKYIFNVINILCDTEYSGSSHESFFFYHIFGSQHTPWYVDVSYFIIYSISQFSILFWYILRCISFF